MSRSSYHSHSRSSSSSPPMDVHMRYHPRYISETIAIQQRQQYLLVQQQIIAEQRMLTIQKEMTLAEENAEECRAQAKRILMERQRRDPEFAYRMQDPVYAQHKLREMIYAVWRDRTNASCKSVHFAAKEMPPTSGYRA